MSIEAKLFRFSLPDVEGALYLYSLRTDEMALRRSFEVHDHGGMKFEDFLQLYEKGKMELVKSLEQVPAEDHDCIPYPSWEFEPSGFELTIREFFDPPIHYRPS